MQDIAQLDRALKFCSIVKYVTYSNFTLWTFNQEVVSSNLTVLQIMWGIAQMVRAPLFSKTVAIYIRYMQQSF